MKVLRDSSVSSIGIAFAIGAAGLPHIMMRFFTVPDAKAARKSVVISMVLIGLFMLMVTIIGYGAALYITPQQVMAVDKGGNMAAPMIAQYLGGEIECRPGVDGRRTGLELRWRGARRAALGGDGRLRAAHRQRCDEHGRGHESVYHSCPPPGRAQRQRIRADHRGCPFCLACRIGTRGQCRNMHVCRPDPGFRVAGRRRGLAGSRARRCRVRVASPRR